MRKHRLFSLGYVANLSNRLRVYHIIVFKSLCILQKS